MKFVDLNGVLRKARRFVSVAGGVTDEDVKSPTKLAELLRGLQRRVEAVEAVTPPEPVEFEVNVGTGGTATTLRHGFNGPVRWYVTTWIQVGGTTYPTSGPLLVQDATSTPSQLVLRSYVAGKAIVRVEPSWADVDPGVTVVDPAQGITEYRRALAAATTTGNVTATDTGLKFPMKANEVWDISMNLICSSSSASGMRFQVTVPALTTMDGMHYSCSTGLTVRLYNRLNSASINVFGTTVHTAAGVAMDDQFFLRVKPVADGDFNLQFSRIAAATTATVGIKSSLIARKVTEV